MSSIHTKTTAPVADLVLARCGVAAGTSILTLDGLLPVEFLTEGDRIVTRDGTRPLKALVTGSVTGPMWRVAPGTMGHNRPGHVLMLGAEAELLVRDWRAQALYGAAQALVRVASMEDGRAVSRVEVRDMPVFALILDEGAVLYADGLELATMGLRLPSDA